MQSNKVNKVVSIASMVQSVDRMKIVRKMNHRLEKVGKTMDVLIQVYTSGEDSKYGIDPMETAEFVEKVTEFERLNIKGLMTIGLFSDDWPEVRKGFARLRKLRDTIITRNIAGVSMEHLSMGMTNDFELAIEEGATMIRIGRAIFGERNKSDSYYWPGIEGSSYKAK
jgi:pyridoxal phosphate enzyme (YggS family)